MSVLCAEPFWRLVYLEKFRCKSHRRAGDGFAGLERPYQFVQASLFCHHSIRGKHQPRCDLPNPKIDWPNVFHLHHDPTRVHQAAVLIRTFWSHPIILNAAESEMNKLPFVGARNSMLGKSSTHHIRQLAQLIAVILPTTWHVLEDEKHLRWGKVGSFEA
ncbi:uncharacterized protein N7469_002265 [Penicillium citrinum]|uniref:Uncharacterized protein n=1 Tax=Penicillium citrinum TaxID=5077 RepID=A0A9W9PA39_PENCI|nr:uncharacterized protein N7469_002265 [Penicillium citrinum]KAJ5240674.1 hypothetical protein N7469_002265 [Penicillium citrinum]